MTTSRNRTLAFIRRRVLQIASVAMDWFAMCPLFSWWLMSYAADWTVEQLFGLAQLIADRIDALINRLRAGALSAYPKAVSERARTRNSANERHEHI